MSDATTQDNAPGMNPVSTAIIRYVEEAKQARVRRMDTNRENFDIYNLNTDWTHKKKGQSTEFLGKQQMAVEQITSFLQQGLTDVEDWFDIELEEELQNPDQPPLITAAMWKKLLNRQLDKIDAPVWAADSIKLGLLGSLMICKVHGRMVDRSKFEVQYDEGSFGLTGDATPRIVLSRKDKQNWELVLDLIRQEDYYPDDTGDKLYEVQAIDIDYHSLLQVARANPGIYDLEVIKNLPDFKDMEQEGRKARETNQTNTMHSNRKRVRIFECWGTILDPITREPIMTNAVAACTPGGHLVRPPKSNPFWHNESPLVTAPIVRVPKSVWHRALMDAPTKHNKAINELYNLMFDGGMMSVFGIKQLREDYLSDPNQVSDGIPAGTTLNVNSQCPPGQKVLERVDTGAVVPESFNMYNLIDKEFQSSSLTNDVRMGNLPNRQVKATEIVASNQTITGIFNGIVKLIEKFYMGEVLRKATLTMAQYMDDLDSSDVKALLGDKAPLVINMAPEERFAAIANGSKFKVFGLSTIMSRINDFRKITSLLQTIAGSPELSQAFQKKYSFTKILGEIVKALDIDEDRIKMTDQELQQFQQEQQQQQAFQLQLAQAGGKQPPGNAKPGAPHGQMSQVPQIGNMSSGQGPQSMAHSAIQTGNPVQGGG